MPHRVANFLRTSSTNIVHIKKQNRKSSSRDRQVVQLSPYASDAEEHSHAPAAKMHDLTDVVKKSHHRLSLPFVRSNSKDRAAAAASSSSLALDWSIESPPIVFYGNPQESTGALVSGQMFLDVKEDVVEIESFAAVLNIHVNHKRPFQSHCSDCQNQYTELESWRFIAQPTKLNRGRHAYPFSVLLAGHLPATMDTPLIAIDYEFSADAKYSVPSTVHKSTNSVAAPAPLRFRRPFHVTRSQPELELPHHSVRVFPPTNIKASAHYMTVIHPQGVNKVTLRLDGLASHNAKGKTVDMWKLKRLSWRLDENIKTISPACEKHVPAEDATTEDSAGKKGSPRKDVRLLGEKQHHSGWKANYSDTDGTVEFEFNYSVNQRRPHSKHLVDVAGDARSRDGTEVTHSLCVELVMSKEYAPEGKPHLAAPTGTGRILRMHYAVTMTDYAGLGVSWDNEAPPVYQDVPPSPPGYPRPQLEMSEPPIDYEFLEPLDAHRASVSSIDEPGDAGSSRS
jgi:hypothetical protein